MSNHRTAEYTCPSAAGLGHDDCGGAQAKASPERREADAEEGDDTARPSAQGPALTPDLPVT